MTLFSSLSPSRLPQSIPAGPAPTAPDALASPDTLQQDLVAANTSSAEPFLVRMQDMLLDPSLWITVITTAARIVLILLIAFVIIRVVKRLTLKWTDRYADLPAIHPGRQRAYTVSNLLNSAAQYVVWPLALIISLDQVGFNVGALIATAGIAGLALGFGAQTLVKDVISGIFLLFDDTIHVGDVIRVGNETGAVEDIGLRLVKVRKFDGELMMIPAGELRVFGNKSIEFARLIVLVGLSYEQDLDEILPVLEAVAKQWVAENPDKVLEEAPTIQAIMDFGDSAITARIAMKVVPGEQFPAEREIRRRLKKVFDAQGIEIPFPRRTLYLRNETASVTVTPPTEGHATAAPGKAI